MGKEKEAAAAATAAAERARAQEEQLLIAAAAANPYAGRYATKSQADIAANRAKDASSSTLTTPVGKQIYDAAEEGDVAKLLPLVDKWFANDVLNWADHDHDGYTPLLVGSDLGRLEAVRLLLATPGEARCCPSFD